MSVVVRHAALALVLVFAAVGACGPKVPAQPPASGAETVAREGRPPARRPPARDPELPTAEVPPDPLGPPIGIASCDTYLALYKACEPRLEAEIRSGERRRYEAERGWIEYVRDTPQGVELSEACTQMHVELESHCQRPGL